MVWVFDQVMAGAALVKIIGYGVTFLIALLYSVSKKKLCICINSGEFRNLCKSIFKVGFLLLDSL